MGNFTRRRAGHRLVFGGSDMSCECRLCGKGAWEIGGYLHRVNELGVTGIWECRPSCDADQTFQENLFAALEDGENAIRLNQKTEAEKSEEEILAIIQHDNLHRYDQNKKDNNGTQKKT